LETTLYVKFSVMLRVKRKASAVLISHCAQRTPRFTEIQVVLLRFKHWALFTRLTLKGLKGPAVNRTLPSLNGGHFKLCVQSLYYHNLYCYYYYLSDISKVLTTGWVNLPCTVRNPGVLYWHDVAGGLVTMPGEVQDT